MTKGEVPVRDMGRVGKELGRLEAVLEKQAKIEDKTAEIQDLEEVYRLCLRLFVSSPRVLRHSQRNGWRAGREQGSERQSCSRESP